MATNHTTNYNLNLWEATDKFSREEINENTQKLDAALGAHQAAISGAVVTGTFTTTPGTRIDINLGFKPKLVFLISGKIKGFRGLAIVMEDYAARAFYTGYTCAVDQCSAGISDSGFYVNGNDNCFNEDVGNITFYAALR